MEPLKLYYIVFDKTKISLELPGMESDTSITNSNQKQHRKHGKKRKRISDDDTNSEMSDKLSTCDSNKENNEIFEMPNLIDGPHEDMEVGSEGETKKLVENIGDFTKDKSEEGKLSVPHGKELDSTNNLQSNEVPQTVEKEKVKPNGCQDNNSDEEDEDIPLAELKVKLSNQKSSQTKSEIVRQVSSEDNKVCNGDSVSETDVTGKDSSEKDETFSVAKESNSEENLVSNSSGNDDGSERETCGKGETDCSTVSRESGTDKVENKTPLATLDTFVNGLLHRHLSSNTVTSTSSVSTTSSTNETCVHSQNGETVKSSTAVISESASQEITPVVPSLLEITPVVKNTSLSKIPPGMMLKFQVDKDWVNPGTINKNNNLNSVVCKNSLADGVESHNVKLEGKVQEVNEPYTRESNCTDEKDFSPLKKSNIGSLCGNNGGIIHGGGTNEVVFPGMYPSKNNSTVIPLYSTNTQSQNLIKGDGGVQFTTGLFKVHKTLGESALTSNNKTNGSLADELVSQFGPGVIQSINPLQKVETIVENIKRKRGRPPKDKSKILAQLKAQQCPAKLPRLLPKGLPTPVSGVNPQYFQQPSPAIPAVGLSKRSIGAKRRQSFVSVHSPQQQFVNANTMVQQQQQQNGVFPIGGIQMLSPSNHMQLATLQNFQRLQQQLQQGNILLNNACRQTVPFLQPVNGTGIPQPLNVAPGNNNITNNSHVESEKIIKSATSAIVSQYSNSPSLPVVQPITIAPKVEKSEL